MIVKKNAKRDAAVLAYKDIQTLRRMMLALSSDLKDMHRDKDRSTNSAINELKYQLTGLRQAQRDRSGDLLSSPKAAAKRTEEKIRVKISELVSSRKFKETIIVGGKAAGTCKHEKGGYRFAHAKVTFNVGHMWLRDVWENIHKGERFDGQDYLVLSAAEYLTNVPQIRLYEVTTYGMKERKQVNGWIGQSKVGDQKCAFKTDKFAAIQAARKLVLEAINNQLGETDHG